MTKPCELVRVDFKTGEVLERKNLIDKSKTKPYNPYKCDAFKTFTSDMAEIAVQMHEDGGDPRKLVCIATDESAEIDWTIFDRNHLTNDEVICALKRVIAKLEAAPSEIECVNEANIDPNR